MGAFLYHHTNTMLVVLENDVEKEANYAKLIAFLALKRKKP
jgi:hypothetical protein